MDDAGWTLGCTLSEAAIQSMARHGRGDGRTWRALIPGAVVALRKYSAVPGFDRTVHMQRGESPSVSACVEASTRSRICLGGQRSRRRAGAAAQLCLCCRCAGDIRVHDSIAGSAHTTEEGACERGTELVWAVMAHDRTAGAAASHREAAGGAHGMRKNFEGAQAHESAWKRNHPCCKNEGGSGQIVTPRTNIL